MAVSRLRFCLVGELLVERVHGRGQFGIVLGKASFELREDASVVHLGVHVHHLEP